MDAIKLLKSRHKQAQKMLHELVHERGPGRESKRAFERVADLLAGQAKLEERVFFPRVHTSANEEMLLEALEVNLAIKRVIADLMTCDSDDPTYHAKTIVLRDLVLKHQHEEEMHIFPAARSAVDGDRLEEIGREMESLLLDLETSSPRQEVPLEIDRAASLDEHFQGVIAQLQD